MYACHNYQQMEEPVTDGDDYSRHRQIVLADVVAPISHSISSSSSITPMSPTSSAFSPRDGSTVQKVPGSDGVRFDMVSPTNMQGTPKFTLPKDWSVEKVRRKGGGTTDKYYRDPETGRQFRSLKEVERYITEGITPTKFKAKRLNSHHHEKNSDSQDTISSGGKNSGSQDMIVVSGKMLDLEEDKDNQYQLVNVSTPIISPTSSFKLPDGWVVEEVPRRSGGYIDKYYYEPGTGQRFRSMVAVQKHLEELEENSPLSVVLEEMRENILPLSKAFKLSSRIKDHGSYNSWKKSISRKEKASSFVDPPSKINWVIAGAGGDAWNAFEDDTLVPDSVKQQWGKTFMMAINNSKHNDPVSG